MDGALAIMQDEAYEEISTKLTIHEAGTREQMVHVRVGQNYFRNAVLSAYESRCCMTGISVPEFLIASHIKPWKSSDDKKEKANPRNGLCLNALHDKAFDLGFITVDKDTLRINDQGKEKHAKVCYNIFCNFRRMRLQKWPILQCQKVHIAKVDFFTIPRKGLSR